MVSLDSLAVEEIPMELFKMREDGGASGPHPFRVVIFSGEVSMIKVMRFTEIIGLSPTHFQCVA